MDWNRKNKVTALVLAVTGCLVYWVSSRGDDPYNYHSLLSMAMSEGRLDYGRNISWMELIEYQGKFYTVNPPMPALLLLPLTWLMGEAVWQPGLTIGLGGISIGIAFLVLLTVFQQYTKALWGAVIYGFGTVLWYHAQVGSGWYAAQITGLFFLWLSLFALTNNKSILLAGLAVSCAMLSRIPMAMFAGFLGLAILPQVMKGAGNGVWQSIWQPHRWDWKPVVLLALGLLPGVFGLLLYNYLRFGEFSNVAYALWVERAGSRVYPHGHLSLYYIPDHLEAMLTFLPLFYGRPPYVEPSIFAMAIWVTTPAMLLIPLARWRDPLIWAVGIGLLISMAPSINHGGVGYSQFGYRFSLDYMPLLIVLMVSAVRGTVKPWHWLLAGVCVLINLWGVIAITWLGQGKMSATPLFELLGKILS